MWYSQRLIHELLVFTVAVVVVDTVIIVVVSFISGLRARVGVYVIFQTATICTHVPGILHGGTAVFLTGAEDTGAEVVLPAHAEEQWRQPVNVTLSTVNAWGATAVSQNLALAPSISLAHPSPFRFCSEKAHKETMVQRASQPQSPLLELVHEPTVWANDRAAQFHDADGTFRA